MRRKIQMYIAGSLVDISEESLVLFNYTQEELTNPTVVRNSCSQSLTLPGTPLNNAVFGSFFRVDRVTQTGDFDALRKTPFTIYDDTGRVLEAGYVKLENIIRSGEQVYGYEISLYGGLGSFFYYHSYNDDGSRKTLADLYYDNPADPAARINPLLKFVNRNASNVAQAWSDLAAGQHNTFYDLLNFAPAYNGKMDGFAYDKAIVPNPVSLGAAYYNVGTEKTVDGVTYTTHPAADGKVLIEMAQDHTEWEMGDLRAYLQRPVIRLRRFLEALERDDNTGDYAFRLDPEFFNDNNAWYTESWLTLPIPPIQGNMFQAISQLTALLNTSKSPAEYVIAIAKTFGLCFLVDNGEKTVTLTSRNKFYNEQSGDVIDLSDRVDRSQEISVKPYTIDARYYLYQNEGYGVQPKKYADAYGRNYGSQQVDTGYEFSSERKDLLSGMVLKGAADVTEGSLYFFENGIRIIKHDDYPDALYFKISKYEECTYKLYHATRAEGETVDTYESYDFPITGWQQEGAHMFFSPWNADHVGYDFLPKVQLHDDNNESEEGSDVLLFYNGIVDIPNTVPAPNIHLSDDDRDAFNTLNEGKPCWIANPSMTQRLTYLPSFRRRLREEGEMIAHLDFGDSKRDYVLGEEYATGVGIYPNFWEGYIADRLDRDTKVMTCKVDLRGLKVDASLLRRFFWYDGCIWVLSRMINHSMTSDHLTECEFVKVKDITAYTESQNYTMTPPAPDVLNVGPASINAEATGKQLQMVVMSSKPWTVYAPEWITVSPSQGQAGITRPMVEVLPNSGDARDGYIMVKTATKTVNVDVHQEEMLEPFLQVYPQTLNAHVGRNREVVIDARGHWEIKNISPNLYIPQRSGYGLSSIFVEVTQGTPFGGAFTVVDEDGTEQLVTVNINTFSSFHIAPSGGTGEVGFIVAEAGGYAGRWYLVATWASRELPVEISAPDWIIVTEGRPGSDRMLFVDVDVNTTGEARVGRILVSCELGVAEVDVYQEASIVPALVINDVEVTDRYPLEGYAPISEAGLVILKIKSTKYTAVEESSPNIWWLPAPEVGSSYLIPGEHYYALSVDAAWGDEQPDAGFIVADPQVTVYFDNVMPTTLTAEPSVLDVPADSSGFYLGVYRIKGYPDTEFVPGDFSNIGIEPGEHTYGVVGYAIEPNDTGEERDDVMMYVDLQSGATAPVIIHQGAPGDILVETAQMYPSAAGYDTYTWVDATEDWRVQTNCDWITVRKNGSDRVDINVAANTGVPRFGVIAVIGERGDIQTIDVFQEGEIE